jgi:hypothetical protein
MQSLVVVSAPDASIAALIPRQELLTGEEPAS